MLVNLILISDGKLVEQNSNFIKEKDRFKKSLSSLPAMCYNRLLLNL